MTESCLIGGWHKCHFEDKKNDASWGGDMLEEVGRAQRDGLKNAGIVE